MRIADTDIPLAHDPAEVVSNAVYWIAAVVVCLAAGWTQTLSTSVLAGLTALALVMQGTGSMLFHGTSDSEHWGQVIDAVGIQWVMTTLLGLSANALGAPVEYVAPAVLAVWVWWWLQADHVSRITSIIVQAVAIIIAIAVAAGLRPAAFTLLLIGGAFGIQRYTPTHSAGHAVWHVLSAAAQTFAAIFMM
jgi:hypothetical protein